MYICIHMYISVGRLTMLHMWVKQYQPGKKTTFISLSIPSAQNTRRCLDNISPKYLNSPKTLEQGTSCTNLSTNQQISYTNLLHHYLLHHLLHYPVTPTFPWTFTGTGIQPVEPTFLPTFLWTFPGIQLPCPSQCHRDDCAPRRIDGSK